MFWIGRTVLNTLNGTIINKCRQLHGAGGPKDLNDDKLPEIKAEVTLSLGSM